MSLSGPSLIYASIGGIHVIKSVFRPGDVKPIANPADNVAIFIIWICIFELLAKNQLHHVSWILASPAILTMIFMITYQSFNYIK